MSASVVNGVIRSIIVLGKRTSFKSTPPVQDPGDVQTCFLRAVARTKNDAQLKSVCFRRKVRCARCLRVAARVLFGLRSES